MKKLISILLIFQILNSAQAHEWLLDILEAEFVEGLTYEIISVEEFKPFEESFECNFQNLSTKIDNKVLGILTDTDEGDVPGCEEFDHFTMAQVAAIMKCAGLPFDYELIVTDPHAYLDEYVSDVDMIIDSPFPIYLGPDTFIEDDHHDNYRLSQGLQFNCVRRVDASETLDSY